MASYEMNTAASLHLLVLWMSSLSLSLSLICYGYIFPLIQDLVFYEFPYSKAYLLRSPSLPLNTQSPLPRVK